MFLSFKNPIYNKQKSISGTQPKLRDQFDIFVHCFHQTFSIESDCDDKLSRC